MVEKSSQNNHPSGGQQFFCSRLEKMWLLYSQLP